MAEEKRIYAVATAHLDTAWKWRLEETIKVHLLDTIGKNFYLFQQMQNYKFNFEGAYRYKLIEEYYPDLFEQLQDYAKEGQWCPAGSAWESCDVNIPSPESLFRNILMGNNYFEEKLGIRSKDIFLPDCFGFGFALPSVIKHANLKGFSTQKIGYGCAAGKPFDVGRWQGVDGSTVFACNNGGSYKSKFQNITEDTSILEKLEHSRKIGSLPWSFNYYGDGDMGGSPDEKSVAGINNSVEKSSSSAIKVISAKADEIFLDLEKLPQEEQNRLPIYTGELLMTSHGVGCYTSRAMSKRLNKKNEILADMAERAACCAMYISNYSYPTETMNTAWKRVIEHQFHDDITGTSMMEVYNRSNNDYFKSLRQFQNEMQGALSSVVNQLDTSFVQGVPIVIYNSVAKKRVGAVEVKVRMTENSPFVQVFDNDGNEVKSQIISKSGKTFNIIFTADVPSIGLRVYDVRSSGKKCSMKSDLKVTEHTLENSKFAVVLNKNGDIGSIIDKKLKKQILNAPIKLALLKDFGDLSYPSWEISYDDICQEPFAFANTPVFKITENGAARVTIEVVRQAYGSTFVQQISLTENGEYIEVHNDIDWQSRRTLLKLDFPFTAFNSNAIYDLGLGVVERGNNSEKLYEVPAQKWADLSHFNGSFGISILSQCKCGWDKPSDNKLRLSCIHTPSGAFSKESRQDLQDLGNNQFDFAIYTHSGDFTTGTQLQSEFFAYPMLAVQCQKTEKSTLGSSWSFGEISDENVLIRAIKKAEKSTEIIVRLNESCGKHSKKVALSLGEIESAREVFASEEPCCNAKVENGKLIFDIEPFQVKSFALTLKKASKTAKKTESIFVNLPYNADVITDNVNRQRNIMVATGVSLPRELFPKTIACKGIEFKPADAESSTNALIPRGNQISVPKGATKMYFLCAALRGDKKFEMTLDEKPRMIYVSDCFEPIAQCEIFALQQKANIKTNACLAFEFSHTHSPADDNYGESASFFICEIDVRGGKNLTLGEDNSIVILAMTATKGNGLVTLATKYIDEGKADNNILTKTNLTDKILDKMDFATISAGKIQNKIKNANKKLSNSVVETPKFLNFKKTKNKKSK